MGLLKRILRFIRRRRPVHPKSVQVLPADAWGRYGRAEQEARVWQQPAEERAREEARRQQHRRAESEERRRQRRAVEKERQRQRHAEEEEGHRQWHAEREEQHRRQHVEERRRHEEAERLAEIRRAEQAQDEDLRVAVENRLDMMVQAKDSMKQAKGVSEFRTAKWRFSVARQDYEEALDERISFTQGRRQSLMGVRETVLETIQEMGSLSGTPEKDT
ncbi:uncharacterized protein J3D65DRAFT_613377 [Phyllosticta citribraziliensis]|uniref:Uncharacterized protein n=1 Tax=Phyllosticta citribraziliensis TaxID=989973 RepID=A0ABR1M405_9PEZI